MLQMVGILWLFAFWVIAPASGSPSRRRHS
jgi:hypothetical protein